MDGWKGSWNAMEWKKLTCFNPSFVALKNFWKLLEVLDESILDKHFTVNHHLTLKALR